jgi:preprotein translocase subunit SecY
MNYKILDFGALFLSLCCGLAAYLDRASTPVYFVGGFMLFIISLAVKYNPGIDKKEDDNQNDTNGSANSSSLSQ